MTDADRTRTRRRRSTPATYRAIYRNARRNAARRKIAFELSAEQFQRIVEEADDRCQVSGIPFDFACANHARRPFAPSLDRIDSSRPYTIDNCRLVSVLVNIAMNTWGDGPLLTVAAAIAQKRGLPGATPPPPRQKSRGTHDWLPLNYRTVKTYLGWRRYPSGRAAQMRVMRIADVVMGERNTKPHIVEEPEYQRVDGSWVCTHRRAFPVDVLDEAIERIVQRYGYNFGLAAEADAA